MSVVQSEGTLVAVDRPWIWPAGNRFAQIGTYSQRMVDYATIYRTQPAVRTVVDFLARNTAQMDLHTFRRISDERRARAEDHPLAQLIDKPNTELTTYSWVRDLVSYLAVYDHYFAIKVSDGQGGMGLWPIPPWKMEVIGNDAFRPDGFKLYGATGTLELDRAKVFYLHGFNPSDPRIGLSPIETLRRVLDEDEAAGEYREFYWRNAARPSSVIERPSTAPDWGETERDRFRAGWRAAYTGALGSGETAILEDDMKLKEFGFSAVDSQYLESRKLTREEVASHYHIPPTLIGILDHATYSNITEQHIMLYSDTLGPWLRFIEQEIQLQLLPEFSETVGIYVRFNIEEKLRGSFEQQFSAIQKAVGAPWMAADEGRKFFGLEPKGGNAATIATPVNLTYDTAGLPNKGAELETLVAGFFERQKQIIMSRLAGKDRTLARGLDTERWTRELTDDLAVLMSGNGHHATEDP